MNVFFCCIDARRCVSSLSGRHSLVWNVARELARVIRIVESNRGGQREKGRKGERERERETRLYLKFDATKRDE